MYKTQILICLTICLKLISAYPPLENEHVNIVENNDTKESNTASFHITKYLTNNLFTNVIKKFEFNNKEQSVEHSITENTSLVNIEITEATTIVNNENNIKSNTNTKNSETNNEKEESVLNNNIKHTTLVITEITEMPTFVNNENKFKNSTNSSATEIITNRKSNSESSTVVNTTEQSPTSSIESDLNTGQTIKIQHSKLDNTNAINLAGVEILQNVSQVCGTLLGKRISFGEPTTLLEFPWTALLLYNTKERYHCGGSLITNKYVLTAAHCVAQEFFELTAVRLGEHDITKEEDCAEDVGGDLICSNTIDVTVNKIIIHHEYSHLSHKNDIALLRLENMIEITRSHYPICLPKANENISDKIQGTVAGWGATEKSIHSNVLMKAEVPILDISKCREVYRYTKFNDTTDLCGSGVSEIDVCKGDSGGAIFYRTSGRKEIYFQLGIISQGVRRCGDSRFLPAVFTKLPAYIKWIENNLEY